MRILFLRYPHLPREKVRLVLGDCDVDSEVIDKEHGYDTLYYVFHWAVPQMLGHIRALLCDDGEGAISCGSSSIKVRESEGAGEDSVIVPAPLDFLTSREFLRLQQECDVSISQGLVTVRPLIRQRHSSGPSITVTKESGSVFCAQCEEAKRGNVEYLINRDESALAVVRLNVVGRYQRQGIGAALMVALCQEAARESLSQVCVCPDIQSIGFYLFVIPYLPVALVTVRSIRDTDAYLVTYHLSEGNSVCSQEDDDERTGI